MEKVKSEMGNVNINGSFTPFGEEWKKELGKMSKMQLFLVFGISGDGISKSELIDRIRGNLIVKDFNEKYKPGDRVLWTPAVGLDPKERTLKTEAYLNSNNLPVVFFEERSGYCSVEPKFLATPHPT